MIYLDHAATSPPRREALEAMWPYLTQAFGNPSSTHALGRQAKAGLETARSEVADVLGCRPGEVIFTSGGTEANNLALFGLALANPRGRHIVVSAIEHEAVMQTAEALVDQHGFRLDVARVDRNGMVDLAHLGELLTEETTLCSVMMANNEVGTIQPIAEIARLCRSLGVPLHTDAVQAAGQLSINVNELGVSAMAISGHKFGGPRGTGVLYVSGALNVEPTMHGGGQQEGRRSGTVDVAGAIGFATALGIAELERPDAAKQMAASRDRLISAVVDLGGQLTGAPIDRLPNHASFVFPGLNGETLLLELEERGVIVSSGSACSADSVEASQVLIAMGYDEDTSRSAVRFTLGRESTDADIDAAIAASAEALNAVRSLS